jgi:hypothetical protein
VSLVGVGFDSGIEVSAALILTWRLARERRGGCMQATDARATRAIALSFVVLGIYRDRVFPRVMNLVMDTKETRRLRGEVCARWRVRLSRSGSGPA